MQIAYLHKTKIKEREGIAPALVYAYMKDMRIEYNKNKKKLTDLGISEIEYFEKMRKNLGLS
jgi:hypothetical protein